MSGAITTARSARSAMRGAWRVLRRGGDLDGATAADRSNERYRRVLLSAASGLLARTSTIFVGLVSVPLAMRYLGDERYGMWLTVSSVLAFVTVADFGLGSGLLTALAGSRASGDREREARYVATASFCLGGIALAAGAGFALSDRWVDWAGLFNVSSAVAVREAPGTVMVAAVCSLAALVLTVVTSINSSHQEGYLNAFWQAAFTALGLLGLWMAIRTGAGLPVLVLCVAGAPVGGSLLNGVVLFGIRRRWLWPRTDLVSLAVARELFASGSAFTVLWITYFAIAASVNLVIAHTLGTAEIPQFAVPAKVFATANMLVALAITPLWPAYTESLARGDVAWVVKTVGRSIKAAAAVGAVPCLALVLYGDRLVHWWVGASVAPTFGLLLGLGLWTFLLGIGNATSAFLFGAKMVRPQAILQTVQLIALVPLEIVLVRRLGVAGIAWALCAAELLFRLLPSAVLIRRLLAQVERDDSSPRATAVLEQTSPLGVRLQRTAS